ncbi:TIGR04219 family outer membrane beta-barrel protein [Thalassotalea agarivorans]|uniref:Outer membrane protein n=1 Tax=Thalassotalea agarivorans TaxID=349064 RepID=A0A1I0DGW3_THASX|nr:TIGR04219 family outer membrane beta-barrel protein [Thalassotalea agarivorans]SET31018.1 outer membrane protein [Thalassotalea agarivorans]
MKKLLIASIAAMSLSGYAQADTIGFEVGLEYWAAKIGGTSDGADFGDVFDDKNNTLIYGALEHPVPIIPNVLLNLNQVNIGSSADINFNDLILYYEVLDNWFELDLGVGARFYDGSFAGIDSGLDPTMYIAYGKGQFNLPVTGLSAGVAATLGSGDGGDTSDVKAYLRWETSIGLGVSGGYRYLSNKIDVGSVISGDAEPDFSGLYLGAFFHF